MFYSYINIKENNFKFRSFVRYNKIWNNNIFI